MNRTFSRSCLNEYSVALQASTLLVSMSNGTDKKKRCTEHSALSQQATQTLLSQRACCFCTKRWDIIIIATKLVGPLEANRDFGHWEKSNGWPRLGKLYFNWNGGQDWKCACSSAMILACHGKRVRLRD